MLGYLQVSHVNIVLKLPTASNIATTPPTQPIAWNFPIVKPSAPVAFPKWPHLAAIPSPPARFLSPCYGTFPTNLHYLLYPEQICILGRLRRARSRPSRSFTILRKLSSSVVMVYLRRLWDGSMRVKVGILEYLLWLRTPWWRGIFLLWYMRRRERCTCRTWHNRVVSLRSLFDSISASA